MVGGSEQAARTCCAPAFPSLPAVAQDRLLVGPQIDSTDLRVVDGVESVAEQLAAVR